MERLICQTCGEPLSLEGEFYVCRYCGSRYKVEDATKFSELLAQTLDEFKIESLAKARMVQYEATRAKYPVKAGVIAAATAVLAIRPEDFLAKVYLRSYDGDPHAMVRLLSHADVTPPEAKIALQWLLPGLQPRWIGALRDFVERNLRNEELTDALIQLEEESAKIEEGIYDASLPRDVFLCYSSADMPKVLEVMEVLEENDISCYAAFRNLRAGRGAAEAYNEEIEKAMKSCGCLVFLSSSHSRSPKCDAISIELPFLYSDLPEKPRAEYLLEDYPSSDDPDHRVPIRAKRVLDMVFDGLQWVRGEEELVDRVIYMLTERKRHEKEKLERIKKEAVEKAKKEILAEMEARDAIRQEEEAKKRQEVEEKERILQEEKAKQEKKDRELQEKKLELEKQRIEIEKAKLSHKESAGPTLSGNLDGEAFLAMMEKAQKLKKEKEEAEKRRQIEEEAKRREQLRQEEKRRQEEEKKRQEEQKRQEDILKRSFRYEKNVAYYGNYPWVPVDFDSKKKQMLICCTHSVGEMAMGDNDEVESFLAGKFQEAFPDHGAKFAKLPFLQSKEELERLAFMLPRLGFAVWTGSKEKGSRIIRKADETFATLDSKEKAFVWPFAILDLKSLSPEEAAILIDQYKASKERATQKKEEAEKKAKEKEQQQQWQKLKEDLVRERLSRAIIENSLTKPVFSWKDEAVYYGIYPQVLVQDPPSPNAGEKVGPYQKIGDDFYCWKGNQCFLALPIKWVIVGKAYESLVLRAEKILDDHKYDRRSEAILEDYRLSNLRQKFLNRDFLSLAFPLGHRHVYAEKEKKHGLYNGVLGSKTVTLRQVFLPAATFFGLTNDWDESHGKTNRKPSDYLKSHPLKNTDFSKSDIVLVTNGALYKDLNFIDTVRGDRFVNNDGIFGKTFGIVPCILLNRNQIAVEEDPDFEINDPKAAKKAEAELQKLRDYQKAKEEEKSKKQEEERVKLEQEQQEKLKKEQEEKLAKEKAEKERAELAAALEVEKNTLADTGVYQGDSSTVYLLDIAKHKGPVKQLIIASSVNRIEFYDGIDDLREAYNHRILGSIESIEVDPDNPVYFSVDGYLIRKEDHCLLWCPPAKKGNLKLPAQVERINSHAFGVVRPDVTSIDLNNGSLKFVSSGAIICGKCQVFVPASVVMVDHNAFAPRETTTIYFEQKKPLIGYPNGYDKKMLGTDHKPVTKWGVLYDNFLAVIRK
ncbi:MAG: TIR domain-containing protein [Bacilli bacterium]|nr:TIR domain-containing protein [Bacilli bacterium]